MRALLVLIFIALFSSRYIAIPESKETSLLIVESSSELSDEDDEDVPIKNIFIAGSIDGTFSAVDRDTGNKLWSSSTGNPLFSSFTSPEGGTFDSSLFIPSTDGQLYLFSGNSEGIQAVPQSVQQIVDNSPFVAPDGTIFVGKKETTLFMIDPSSGAIIKSYSVSEPSCPDAANPSNDDDSPPMLLGRVDYSVRGFSPKGTELWNMTIGTFVPTSYSEKEWNSFSNLEIGLDGTVRSKDDDGKLAWVNQLNAPASSFFNVIYDGEANVYEVQGSTSHLNAPDSVSSHIFVAQHEGQLYAMSKANAHLYLNEPSDLLQLPYESGSQPHNDQGSQVSTFVSDYDSCLPSSSNFPQCLLGLHHISNFNQVSDLPSTLDEGVAPVPTPLYQQNYPVAVAVIVGLGVGLGAALWKYKLSKPTPSRRKRKSKPKLRKPAVEPEIASNQHKNNDNNNNNHSTMSQAKDTENPLGQLSLTENILGYGSSGTIVYEGSYAGRKVAVKRMLKPLYQTAHKEVSLLLESDEHPNVVRYFAKVEDGDFIYLALSYCSMTLEDLVNDETLDFFFAQRKKVLFEIVTAVAHLHELNIVHRDLKPQNILLTENQTVKISDMGLAKKLENKEFFSTTGAIGTVGWQAPELLLNEQDVKKGEKVDVFSLGCLFYYVLTRGYHPFGERYERQKNVLKAKFNLGKLRDEMGKQLISQMIHSNPSERPTAASILKSPLFWEDKRKLLFLKDVSDRLEIEKPSAPIVLEIEDQASKIFGEDWSKPLGILMENLGKFRKYNTSSVRDLLRLIRNKSHHYYDLPAEAQKLLGSLPSGFLKYFSRRFPLLFPALYSLVRKHCYREPTFKHYL